MTPLAPLYLLGALAVVGPILFHLWRRTPRGRREFSTLMFLTQSPPRVTSRSRIEHWLLLLLRGAIVCLLALAFARPLWRTATSEPEQANDEELVAVLVDTSASLRRDGAWPDLMRQVSEQLSKLPAKATVALFRFDDRWTAVADFSELKTLEPTARRELVRARLNELKPTWGGTNLGEALVRTASALQEAQTDRAWPAKLRILLASDLPTGANLDALHGFEWPGDLRVEPLVAQATSSSNAGLQLVERNLDLGDDLLRVRVTNSADARKESFSLRWEGSAAAAVPVYVPPGQSRVIAPPKRPEEAASTSLILTGDDHDFDNKVHIAEARSETKLVVYCGTDKPDDPEGLRFYLEGVFAASRRYRIEMIGWRENWKENPLTLSLSPQGRGEGTRGERPSLVVLVEPEADAGAFVTGHLASGGAVLIAARSPNNGTASLKQCGLEDVSLTEATVRRDAMLGDIDFEHSLFAPFAESQFSDFTGIRFWKHRALAGLVRSDSESNREVVSRADGTPQSGMPRVLCRFDDGSPAFVEFTVGKGRVWLMTAGWHPSDSQLARSSKFPPLMFRMLEQAAGVVSRPESVSVGSSIPWPTSAAGFASRGTVRLPDGRAVTDLPLESAFAETDQPGLYGLEVEGRSDTVAVNLAVEESRTAPLPIEQLESLGVRLGTAERPEDVRRAKDRERQLQLVELEQTQKLWRWGLLAVIGLLLIETWLAGRTGSPIEPSS
jgi:aerotolerance regulator-like protein/VWA domain-containing protein